MSKTPQLISYARSTVDTVDRPMRWLQCVFDCSGLEVEAAESEEEELEEGVVTERKVLGAAVHDVCIRDSEYASRDFWTRWS